MRTSLGRQHASLVVETWVLMPDPSAAGRPELLHRDHVLHELIDGALGALLKARRLVFLQVRFIPAQRQT
jgi:hypothetical protein